MTPAAAPAAPARGDRLRTALPLAVLFAAAAALYLWQAFRLATPWLFTDELEHAQLARAIAESGRPELRGEPAPLTSLYELVTAPAWLLDDVESAYDVAKAIGAVAMTTAMFPAYALARLIVSRRAALLAAAGSVAIPAFMYASLLLQEPLAYPYATLCFYAVVRALSARTRGWLLGAAALTAAAPLVRTQLAVLPVVYALSGAVVGWQTERARRWRRDWSRWDHVGAAVLALGALVVVNEVISRQSEAWGVTTRHYQDRLVDYALWGGGALTIGLGVLPVVAGLAMLARPTAERADDAFRAFAVVLLAAGAAFVFYAAVKAAFLSTEIFSRVPERNLIYLAPLLFAAFAAWVERPSPRIGAAAAAGALALLVVVATPIALDYPYFEAPGFSVLAYANRRWEWSKESIDGALLVVVVGCVAFALLPRLLGPSARSAAAAAAVVPAVAVLAWNVAGELTASAGSREIGERFVASLPDPPSWVDNVTRGRPTIYLGKQVTDPDRIHLLEFWNRSLERIWTLDGSAPGPGPTLTPDVTRGDGALSAGSDFPFVVAEPGIDLQATPIWRAGIWTVYRVRPPLRLRSSLERVYEDSWIGSFGAYNRFAEPGDGPGKVIVTVSRVGGGQGVGGGVLVQVGPLRLDENRQPQLDAVTDSRAWDTRRSAQEEYTLRAPRPPYRVEVTVGRTFVPAELDARSGDRRELGVQVAFAARPRRAQAK